MNDIVETLRETFERRRYGADAEYHPDFDLFDVAADEIQRLRAKIEAISQVAGKASIDGITFAQIKGRDSDVLGKCTGESHGE